MCIRLNAGKAGCTEVGIIEAVMASMSKPKAKKQKLDFESSVIIVEDVRNVKATVNHLSSSCADCLAKWQNDLDRVLNRCNTKTLEFMLVSPLGLDGVDCLTIITSLLSSMAISTYYHDCHGMACCANIILQDRATSQKKTIKRSYRKL